MNNTLLKGFCLCLTYLSIHFLQAQPEKEIRILLQKQQDAWNQGNLDAFMDGYWQSDSLQFIGKNGITWGYNATLARYKKSYPDAKTMGQLTFTILQMQPLGKKYYFITGKWHLARAPEIGNAEGHFTLIFKQIDKKWCIIADHSS
ncbi:MAG: nuclear transport factor 2 family protein [Cytophagales bacterium]|nr:MAG: nuclear transport factor 2 family protein [Cytophagales bacterium]